MSECTKEYEAGIRDGRINAIASMQASQNGRLDNHELTLRKLEKLYWLMMGAIAVIEVFTRLPT